MLDLLDCTSYTGTCTWLCFSVDLSGRGGSRFLTALPICAMATFQLSDWCPNRQVFVKEFLPSQLSIFTTDYGEARLTSVFQVLIDSWLEVSSSSCWRFLFASRVLCGWSFQRKSHSHAIPHVETSSRRSRDRRRVYYDGNDV